jgi:ribosomal protein L21
MVARTQVDLGEVAGTVQLVQELVHHQDEELVLGRPRIEGVIVDAETPGPV